VEAQSGVFVARLCAVGLMLPSLWRVLLVSWLPVVVWYCTLFRGFSVENARGADPLLPVWFYNVSITLAYGRQSEMVTSHRRLGLRLGSSVLLSIPYVSARLRGHGPDLQNVLR